MSHPFIKLNKVSFEYPDSTHPIINDLSLHLSTGWTGVIGPNGSGKSTLLKIVSGMLSPGSGKIQSFGSSLYCEQRTDSMPTELPEFIASYDPSARRLQGQLGIRPNWQARWTSLSHGERKRAQIAIALWKNPELLAIDEPTNHVDRQASHILREALEDYTGIGLLVSHDRDLLDTLCSQCLFIDEGGLVLKPGGYSKAMESIKHDQRTIQRARDEKSRVYRKLKREAVRRRQRVDQQAKHGSKRHISSKDHDAKAKVDSARLSGKDARGTALYKRMQDRALRVAGELNELKVQGEQVMGIWLEGSLSKRDTLYSQPAESIQLGEKRLMTPELTITPDDRIGLIGPNGAGKSTLLRSITSRLVLDKDRLTYIPQEISEEDSVHVHEQCKALSNSELGHVMTIVSRLGSRPDRLLESSLPSPGEIRKLMLALGILQDPHLIILDEPTNHMDLPSTECLEAALVECPCALLVVSHDYRFIRKVASSIWVIDRERGGYSLHHQLVGP